MKAKAWLSCWLILVVSILSVFGYWVYKVDPYFHYHIPKVDKYYYPLNYQRGQNDGIIKHFDYDAIITGSSMIENFKTTEAEEIFGFRFIKIPFSGASYKEINDNVQTALKANPNVKIVIRGLDSGRFLDAWDEMRYEPKEYPSYLYDSNPLNDVKYLLNKDVLFSRVFPMMEENDVEGFQCGITTFDNYSRWQDSFSWGFNSVCPDGISVSKPETEVYLTDEDKTTIEMNIRLNVTSIADEYPNTEFYYFYTPYSIASWNSLMNSGTIYQILEAEEYITELITPHKNIHLFSFNNRTDMITDLNNYKDAGHYACWFNSLMLKWMHDDEYRLTEENYKDYLQKEYDFYTSFDYTSLNGQVDYECAR